MKNQTRKIKDICIANYCYADGRALLASQTEVERQNYLVRRATKAYLIKNFSGILVNDNCSPKEAKETLRGMSRDEILKEIETFTEIIYF